jgi:hypothetical protein
MFMNTIEIFEPTFSCNSVRPRRNAAETRAADSVRVKILQASQEQIRRGRLDALIEGRIAALFRRLPMLSGFVVQEDLLIAEVAIQSWAGAAPDADIHLQIVDALKHLVEERPDAVDLLRGRTFARTLH